MAPLDAWERRILRHARGLRKAIWDRDAQGMRRQLRGLFDVALEDAFPPPDVVDEQQSHRPADPFGGEAARSGAPPLPRPPCQRSDDGG